MTNDLTSHAEALLAQLDLLTEAGKLRRLSGAFARFIGAVGEATPQLLLACALLSELEGRGHSCLMLDELAADPCGLMGWSEEEWAAVRQAADGVPQQASAWRDVLAQSPQVWTISAPDGGPLRVQTTGAPDGGLLPVGDTGAPDGRPLPPPTGAADGGQPLVLAGDRLYLRRYWRDETAVAGTVRARALELRAPDLTEVRHWLDILFGDAAATDGPDWQKIACAVAVHGNLAIITGGPGTGKTYTVARLLALLFAMAGRQRDQLRVALAAPTGKAAARLKQSIDHALDGLAGKVGAALPLRELAKRMGSARTLHSLLGARPDTRAFQHNRGNPLDVDVLIVDEASMVHLEMMASLMDALPPHAMLILLGDKDQLASVEAGAVLGDLCHEAEAGGYTAATLAYVQQAAGQTIPPQYLGDAGALAQQTVMLRHSRRFSGPIGALAQAVNAGNVEAVRQVLRGGGGEGRDGSGGGDSSVGDSPGSGGDGAGIGAGIGASDGKVAWIEPAQQADVLRLALSGRAGAGGYRSYLTLVKDGAGTMPHEDWVRSVLASFESFRILCAVRDGEWGVSGLNASIEQSLEKAGLLPRRGEWYVGRPVMVTRNDYGTQVFNGDIGLTLPDPARPGYLRVYFSDGEKVRSVLATRLRNVETAFAMTVHKSQGSEFGHTVLVLPKDGGSVIARELIYTGITRAREFFTLVSPAPQVLLEAVALKTQRASGLRSLIGA